MEKPLHTNPQQPQRSKSTDQTPTKAKPMTQSNYSFKGSAITGMITFVGGTLLGLASTEGIGAATPETGIIIQIAGLGMTLLSIQAAKGETQ